MKHELKDFLASEEKEIEIEMKPLDYYVDLLKDLGFERTDEGDTNGWQVDFWEFFLSKKHGKLCLSGSLWYGGFKLRKEEGDDEA